MSLLFTIGLSIGLFLGVFLSTSYLCKRKKNEKIGKITYHSVCPEIEEKEDFLYYDFQGWPVYKKKFGDLLKELGAEEKDGVIGFKTDNSILDIYAETLEDDGMGMGINKMFFTGANISEDEEKNKKIYFWRDIKWPIEYES